MQIDELDAPCGYRVWLFRPGIFFTTTGNEKPHKHNKQTALKAHLCRNARKAVRNRM
jgi:hypothetical protein